jgi:hypothetical protein
MRLFSLLMDTREDTMAFVTTSLPFNGISRQGHFAVSYDDTLAQADGLDRSLELLNDCESDLALIQGWFTGVAFQFAFPIGVQISGSSGGATWTDPPDIALWFGFRPTIGVMPGPRPTTGLIRFLIIAEVTEMFMASQRKNWFGDTHTSGALEGSMGESLSRFLALHFLSINGYRAGFPNFIITDRWLNSPARPNFVDVAPNDNGANPTTACGTLFLFFLKDQLGFSVEQIIAAAAPTLARVYTNLTGKIDGWQTFKELVDLHYPIGGTPQFPPLDNIFPVADLLMFSAPPLVSWVSNETPNIYRIVLSHSVAAPVDVMLSSDDPATIDLGTNLTLDDSSFRRLDVKAQSAAFVSKVVNLTASYAGKKIAIAVKVVRPEDLPVSPLDIQPLTDNDLCAQHFVAGGPQDFVVKNTNVLLDRHGLTYSWTVVGATAPVTNTATLTIPSLPRPGSKVTISVVLRTALGLQAKGKLEFTTTQLRTGFREEIRYLNCSLRHLKAIETYIPPNVPIEEVEILKDLEQLTRLESHSREVAAAAQRLAASVKTVRASLKAK